MAKIDPNLRYVGEYDGRIEEKKRFSIPTPLYDTLEVRRTALKLGENSPLYGYFDPSDPPCLFLEDSFPEGMKPEEVFRMKLDGKNRVTLAGKIGAQFTGIKNIVIFGVEDHIQIFPESQIERS